MPGYPGGYKVTIVGLFSRSYKSVNVKAAKALIADGATLVDVRSEREWRRGHANGAVHIPLDQLESRMVDLPIGTPILTICHSGVRSGIAACRLATHGHQVSSVRGGMIAWNHTRS